MSHYTIHLINVGIVRPTAVVRSVIEGAVQPLADQAGHTLNLVNVSPASASSGTPDVSLEFNGSRPRLGEQFIGGRGLIFGEQSGAILVGNILEYRVGGGRTRTPLSAMDPRRPTRRSSLPAQVDHMSSMRSLFLNGEREFARAVGNIAVHELGHTIAGLDHHQDRENFMFTGASLQRQQSRDWHTYENLRGLWSSRKSFDTDQASRLVAAIRARDLAGVSVSRSS